MSLKIRLKLGLFINKQTWTSFLSSRAQVVHDRLGSFTALVTDEENGETNLVFFIYTWLICRTLFENKRKEKEEIKNQTEKA